MNHQPHGAPLADEGARILRRDSRHAGRAFTIIEVIVIVVILGVLAAIIAPRLLQRIGQSRQAVANSNAASLATILKTYEVDCGALRPGTTIDVLWTRPPDVEEGNWKGPYVDNVDALIDPWGNKFILLIPSQHANADFDIVSYGADGQPGGEGEDGDIIRP
jgi:general secretion pathway protein G